MSAYRHLNIVLPPYLTSKLANYSRNTPSEKIREIIELNGNYFNASAFKSTISLNGYGKAKHSVCYALTTNQVTFVDSYQQQHGLLTRNSAITAILATYFESAEAQLLIVYRVMNLIYHTTHCEQIH